MRIVNTGDTLRELLAPLRSRGRVALVPTMGCLHEGHAALMREARKRAEVVVASVYVNPLQFGPNEDFSSYPRSFDADAKLCETGGVDVVFHPENLYPAGGPLVTLGVKELSEVLCGAARPGHFDGVVTVVNILFNLVQPDLAVFGEKDWQQLAIIRRMVSDLCMPVDIAGVPTVRESGGLAMSSRNRYLDKSELLAGRALSAALSTMQLQAIAGERDAAVLLDAGRRVLATAGIEPEYLDIRFAASLQTAQRLGEAPARAFVAARIGPARLIDNMPLEHL